MIRAEDLNNYLDDMIIWRRDFHQHPELGFQEVRTSSKIVEILEDLGIEVIKDFCHTAVVGIVKGMKDKPVVALRADIDALGMQDEKDVSYKSQTDGVCHACGHDAHTAIGIAMLKYYSEHREDLKGTLKVIFQPAEEGPPPGGAKLIMETDVVNDIDMMLGYHCDAYPVGKVRMAYGVMGGSSDNFRVVIEGKGGHAALPQMCSDQIVTAMTIIDEYQKIISRTVDPMASGVISVTYFQAGDIRTCNVIPDKVVFGGTVRTLSEETREHVFDRMEAIGQSIASINGNKFCMEREYCTPVLFNDRKITNLVRDVVEELLGKNSIVMMEKPDFCCDDFAYYSNKIPTTFFGFGAWDDSAEENYFMHHPKFNIDEKSMAIGMAIMINSIEQYNDKYEKN